MSTSNGRPRKDDSPERAKYEAATSELLFTKDFHPALEALMWDFAATYGQRFLAWLKRRSWGNYRLYAVLDNGKDATQADAARELVIDKRVISQLTNYYEKRGYLYREGKKLYPTISPQPALLTEKVMASPDFLEFKESWKVTYSSDFLQLQVAQETVKRIEMDRLAKYKEWKKAKTNGAPTLYREEESRERDTSSSSGVVVLPEEPEEETTTTIPEPAKEPEPLAHPVSHPLESAESPVAVLTEVLTEALEAHPIGGMPSAKQIEDLIPLLPAGATPAVVREFGAFITAKLIAKKLKNVGGLPEFMREYTRLYRPKKTSHSRGQPATKRVLRCPGCKSQWVTAADECASCGIPYSAFVMI